MITSNYQVDGDIYSYADKFFCDSHDDKPTNADTKDGLINGAILEETDTGKTYIFDKKADQWTEKAAGGGGGGSSTLAGLTDVDLSNPSNGQTLVYIATSQKWENGAGGDGILVVTMDDQTGALDHTASQVMDAAMRGIVICPITDDMGHGEYEITLYQLGYISYVEGSSWHFGFSAGTATVSFDATSLDDYPIND